MKRIISLGSIALLAACTVGTDYAGPPPTATDAVSRGTFSRAADATLSTAPGLARWWEGFDDPALTRLVDDALASSPTIDEAVARVREAQARLSQQRSNQAPSASAIGAYMHAELPGVSLSAEDDAADDSQGGGRNSLDFYNAGLTASWEPDLFGGGRRSVEQARAVAQARAASLADVQVSLSAQVAQAYVSLRDVQERIRLNDASTRLHQQQLDLSRQRLVQGTASKLDIERLENQLETSRADAIPLAAQRDESLDQLAVLTGRAPGALDQALNDVAMVPLPPDRVPIGNPAALIAHRPDIRSAERQLAAANAAIGVSKAQELPGISFLGFLGLGGTSPGDVLDPGSLAALVAPSLNWSFLDFGRNRAATRVSQAQRDEADATYRRTVLEALQDAETSLSRFGNRRAHLAQLVRAEAAAGRAAKLNRLRVNAGTSTLIDQLDIERQKLAADIAVTQAKAQLSQSYIAVNKALGLGWAEAAP